MLSLKEFKLKLDEIITNIDRVFIVPHNGVDFDAIASCISMSLIMKKMKKSVYLIIDEDPLKIEPGVKIIIEEMRNNLNIISLERYRQLPKSDQGDLLVAMDVNKNYLVCCKDYLSQFKYVAIMDHHKEDDYTIDTEYKVIDTSVSSVSELMVDFLCLYSIKYDSNVANYLLAGIYLDTNKFNKNVTSKTMHLVSKLMERGADLSRVNELFEEDFFSDRKVQELVSKANFFTYTIATCIADDSISYTKEELSKVADYLLKYKVDAAFAVGHITEDLVSISARSKGKIDVGEVMKVLNGGGNVFSAATKIEDMNISEVGKKLERTLTPNFYKEKL